jgi:predicted nucleic acid-binding protein
MLTSEVFLDTAYAIALSSPKDKYHARAEAIADELEQRQVRLVTTRAVLLEIGSALARQRFRSAAVALLDALEHDPTVAIVPLSEALFASAFQLYRARPDKEWGLTDCVSFTVMMDRGLTEALTTDDHFRQAGFRALLLDRAD